ncbi:PilX N-terminal domain-containing pilus assembly protein [Thiohalomonas denitrificans]|uniref:PilX N-terminal n=1 Tax=Thiohalomonas denitrificans TaxID=415747 RepID=A0A1G5PQA8_9GAMM|nr:PilX N-terminal domain-containing pilus assembly protein [Thiohalomonas denitrificans]SCZ51618.1 PilX N-terminal [Thiohalomonas denitrificans]
MKTPRETGAVLIVSLLMLVVLTLLGVSAVNTGVVNLRVVGNMQAQTRAELATEHAVREFLSDISNFTTPTSETITASDVAVVVSQPVCRRTTPASGYSASWALVPEDNEWEFRATVTDGPGNANSEILQGVKVRMVADSCP